MLFAFLLINIPISVRITIKGIVYYIVTISFHILGIRACIFTITGSIIICIVVIRVIAIFLDSIHA